MDGNTIRLANTSFHPDRNLSTVHRPTPFPLSLPAFFLIALSRNPRVGSRLSSLLDIPRNDLQRLPDSTIVRSLSRTLTWLYLEPIWIERDDIRRVGDEDSTLSRGAECAAASIGTVERGGRKEGKKREKNNWTRSPASLFRLERDDPARHLLEQEISSKHLERERGGGNRRRILAVCFESAFPQMLSLGLFEKLDVFVR